MKLMVERDSDSGKKKGGRAGKTKATWKVSGIYPQCNPAGSITRSDLAIHRRPALTRRFTSNLTEHYDSLVTRQAGQTDDKAQGPEGRFMLMVGRFKRKGMRNIYLTRS